MLATGTGWLVAASSLSSSTVSAVPVADPQTPSPHQPTGTQTHPPQQLPHQETRRDQQHPPPRPSHHQNPRHPTPSSLTAITLRGIGPWKDLPAQVGTVETAFLRPVYTGEQLLALQGQRTAPVC